MCNKFNNENGFTITYATVRRAMDGKPFTMSLTSKDEIEAIVAAVNQGIDSRLQACFCPGLGDRYAKGNRTIGETVVCHTLECSVSVESFPTLVRRLFESENEIGWDLASNMLYVLGFDEYGKFVGREALGLE